MRAPFLKLCLATALWAAFVQALAAEAGFQETEVKAAFVYNLVKFVEWPAGVISAGTTFRLCHEGVSALQERALAGLEGKLVGGLPVQVQSVKLAGGLKSCHAVVMGPNSTIRPQQCPDGVLTIGEGGFVDEGGMIGLVTESGNIYLEFNIESARRAHIRIPAQVLQLGRKVKGM